MAIGSRINTSKDSKETNTSYHNDVIQPRFKLDDLILPSSTLSGIYDFLSYKKNESRIFQEWGLNQTHHHQQQTTINLYGASGAGKTMAAHAIANELEQALLVVDYAHVESKYVGDTSKNITAIFKQAKEQNAIIFFDEADAILSRRVTNMTQASDVSVNQTRSVLLTLMNDHQGLIIFTTNFIENYDPAFMRRILAHIHFELPDLESRQRLWRKYISPRLPIAVEMSDLASISEGLSGSDIANSVLKAAMSAARKNCNTLTMEHFQNAIFEIKQSKSSNSKRSSNDINIEKRTVTEDYVKSKIGHAALEELKYD